MTRFETPGQVLLLLTGVAVVTVLLMALLNVEANKRKMKDPEIQNGNLFEALGRQIGRWGRRLGHSGTHHSDLSATVGKRSLQAIHVDGDAVSHHQVRHHGKHRRKQEPSASHNTTTNPPEEGNRTSPHSRRLSSHDACYSTNQVLLVIAVTCAVNLTFICVVMTLVHLCNRSGSKVSRLDSVVLAEDTDCYRHDQKCHLEGCKLRGEAASYSSVQEYVNSLPSIFDGTASMLSLHSIHAARDTTRENSLHTSHSMENLLFLG